MDSHANQIGQTTSGLFCGIGVGPGMPGLIPVVAWEFLQNCDLILHPRAKYADRSVARNCLPPHQIPESRFREIEFAMESDRRHLAGYYSRLADEISDEVRAGKRVAYLTIGDPLTYSTYIYLLRALRERSPGLAYRTYPGITSYCALAATTGFAIGEGKERVLILPCPNDMHELRGHVEAHDVVILMKIGDRLPAVLQLLDEMEIGDHCAFGAHVGMENEVVSIGISELGKHLQPRWTERDAEKASENPHTGGIASLGSFRGNSGNPEFPPTDREGVMPPTVPPQPDEKKPSGYLSTMLIRRKPAEPRRPITAAEPNQQPDAQYELLYQERQSARANATRRRRSQV
ncbi:MAG: precorrin-2 C(20)-methyltransferase [Verrucomicrobia bacterium]|nr:precorrin-2 C(20)-methyltransferase [Verrucomicrobiota bacterium]